MADVNTTQKIGSFVMLFVALSCVIAVHEFGHFTFAKIFNVSVPAFSIGFGPVLFEKQIGETKFRFSALPLGGYTEIHGMAGDARTNRNDSENSFEHKPYWQKFLILIAGVFFNFIFAFLIYIYFALKKQNLRLSLNNIKENETLNAQTNTYRFFFFIAILNINLALFNLLPIPILDGGQIVLYGLEALTGAQIPIEIRIILAQLSWLIIIILAVLLNTRSSGLINKKTF